MKIEDFLSERNRDAVRLLANSGLDDETQSQLALVLLNQRLIIDWHKNWPVLVETQPEITPDLVAADWNTFSYKIAQRIEFLTMEEYRRRFGEEPPTAPLLRQMANHYNWHPDYDTAWEI